METVAFVAFLEIIHDHSLSKDGLGFDQQNLNPQTTV
jgi:hypothetical protein